MNKETKRIQGLKNSIEKNVKQAFRQDKFLTYCVNGRVAYVFSPKMRNKVKNNVIHGLAHSFHELLNGDGEYAIYHVPSSSYPIQFKQNKAADIIHNVLISIEDQNQLEYEGVDKENVCGKSLTKAYEWYDHLYGPIEKHVYKKSIRKLARRKLIVVTVMGTVWFKPYFNERGISYDFALNYEELVKRV